MANIQKPEDYLTLAKKCPEDWHSLVSFGLQLREVNDISRLGLGLLAIKIEKKYKEDALGKFAIEIGVPKVSLQQYRWVASNLLEMFTDVNFSDKIGNLSYAHLRIAAGTEDPEGWVDTAIAKNYTSEQLALAIKGVDMEKPEQVKTTKTKKAALTLFLQDFFQSEGLEGIISIEVIDRLAIKIDEFYKKGE